MTRLFHAAAGAIILTAAWFAIHRPPAQATAYEPQSHLIDVLQQAGLTFSGRREIAQGEALLLFRQFGCGGADGRCLSPVAEPDLAARARADRPRAGGAGLRQ